ncbi:SAM-dependent methyltransferase, partial [Gammaproteobacteria bacterium]|nr:SAM-dependent methyltransferase [Gammaproteobacteria bacterium]
SVDGFPLSFYRNCSFYTMRTDSRDRFGTPLEQRFTQSEINELMLQSGFKNIVFSESEPKWCVVGIKS